MSKDRGVNKCRHFNGAIHEKCAANVSYREIARVKEEGEFGWGVRIPCYRATEDKYPCPCLSRFTDEEIRLQKEQGEEDGEKYFVARMCIMTDIESRGLVGKSVSGSIKCPCCEGGRIHYSYAGAYNGHIHANCSSGNCLSWME